MSLKKILGLDESGISDWEIMKKITEAQDQNLDEVEFITEAGEVVKISLPHIPFYPGMDKDSW